MRLLAAAIGAGASSGGEDCGANGGGGGRHRHPRLAASLAERFVKSLPKLLWLCGASRPATSAAIVHSLLEVGRATDALVPLQPSLVPFFCGRSRKGGGALLGPYARLPPATRRAAGHVVCRLGPLGEALLSAFASCAAEAPHCVPELLQLVEGAHARGMLSSDALASFALTLALEAALPPTPLATPPAATGPSVANAKPPSDAETAARHDAWEPCLATIRRLSTRARGTQVLAALRSVCVRHSGAGRDAASPEDGVAARLVERGRAAGGLIELIDARAHEPGM